MDAEKKALIDVVQRFGRMISELEQDYIKFKDWFENVVVDKELDRIKEMKHTEEEQKVEQQSKILEEVDNLLKKDNGDFSFNIEDIDNG